jgi:hypothetical protein
MSSIEAPGCRAMKGWRVRAACVLSACALSGSSCVRFASELDTLAEDERSGSPEQAVAVAGRDWSCTGAAAARADGAGSQAPLTYSLTLVDFVTRQPLDGVRVRSCFRADVNCETPLSDMVVGSSAGPAQVTAYEGFNGYLELSVAGMLPSLLFFAAPWSPALLTELDPVPVPLLPDGSLEALGSAANVQLDVMAGVVAVTALDCAGITAGGVRLELDRSGVPYVFVDDLPVANRDSTGAQGIGGFVNVQPGVVVISGYREGADDLVGVESMLVRTGWLSQSFLLPAFSR